MGTKRAKKALLEVIPPRICVTFRRASFWTRPETSKLRIWKHPGRKHNKYRVRKPRHFFLTVSKIMKIGRHWTHIRLLGLRIKDFESQRCYEANGTTGKPQNCHIKFKIGQKSNWPHRPQCTLNYSVNRILNRRMQRTHSDATFTTQVNRNAAAKHTAFVIRLTE